MRRLIETAASCEYPVLITGETGAGKDLVAREIHAASSRGSKKMVVLDCSTVSESLLESELFGHVRGAFTGATLDREGLIAQASGSSLFLDEVDSMTPRMQAALLRVLETGEYRRVGSSTSEQSSFRVIAAARSSILEQVQTGTFRQDLYYRLSALHLSIPPLRDRGGDASEIAADYVRALGGELSRSAARRIDAEAWPGNVRQLLRVLDVASVMGSGRVDSEALTLALSLQSSTGPVSRSPVMGALSTWQRVRAALAAGGAFGVWDYARVAGVSRRSAQRHLARLVRSGAVARSGAGRGTKYCATREGPAARP